MNYYDNPVTNDEIIGQDENPDANLNIVTPKHKTKSPLN